MKEWNITWDCLITLARRGGGDVETDEEIKIAVCFYLYTVFGIGDINIDNVKIKKFKKYINVNYTPTLPS